MDALLASLGDEVADAEEETFLLYSRLSGHPSQSSGDLGFVDPKADELVVDVAGKDLTIRQFPILLLSNRAEGTTGAVLWRITPLLAEWLASRDKLGSGVAGIILLTLAPLVGEYIATDQPYILQHLNRNIESNAHLFRPSKRNRARGTHNLADRKAGPHSTPVDWKIRKLDWESDSAIGIPEAKDASMTVAVDCIYNEALVEPFIRTCADLCRFRSEETVYPTLCVIAQQLRSESVFETFLKSFTRTFHVWRLPENLLNGELRNNASFVIHVGILRRSGDSYIADQIYPNTMLQALNSR